MQNTPSKNTSVGMRSTSDYSGFGVQLDGRTSESEGYRYGFQGMEGDSEIKGEGNSYSTEFRQYDPRIGRWLTTDPVVHHNQSPYCAMDNNPVYLIDPFGTNAGDYYSKEGEHLGSDGEKDNKVYVADGVDKSKKGKEQFTNAKDLGVTHDTFKKFAGVVDQESSGNKNESLAIGTAIVNASNNGGQSIETLIANSNFTKAILSSNYKSFVKSPDNDKYGLSSAVNAFLYKSGDRSAKDYSNGAVLWEGGEFAAKGATHHKSKFYGIDIPTYHWNQLKTYYETTGKTALQRDYGADKVADISAYMSPKGTAYWLKAKNYDNRLLIKSTAVHGGTIFFGKNTGDPRNDNYNWKYLSVFPK